MIMPQKQSRAAALLGAFALLCLLASPAAAQEAILASDVSVDVTGTDASDARAKAMKQAEKDGFALLLDKLAPDQKESILGGLDEARISTLVKGVEVLDEKITGARYRAMLRVSYNAVAVNTLLEKRTGAEDTQETQKPSHAMLVLPLYEEDGNRLLWEPGNPWMQAWKRVVLELSGSVLLAPYGDAADSEIIDPHTLPSATHAALAPMLARYGTSEAVIIRASYRQDPSPMVEIFKRHVGPGHSETALHEYRADPQEDRDQLLYRVARDLSEQLLRQREELFARQAIGGEAENRMMALIPFTTLSGWTQVRGVLLKLPAVRRVDVLAVSPEQVDVLVQFRGPKDMLVRDIAASGLRIVENGNYWIISKD